MILYGADDCLPMTKKYEELFAKEKFQADCDLKASNIILKGLPSYVYSLFNHQRVSKDLYERLQLLMQDLGVADHLIAQIVITHNAAYQADDLDTYDSHCDDFSTAKAVLMANLSSYRSMFSSSVMSKETNVISIADSEETSMLEEESRSKMLLKQSKCFIPQEELSDEQAFRLQTSHPSTNQSPSSPVKIEAPRELPKLSLVTTSLKKLKYHLGQFENLVKKQITPDALTKGEWGV
nr:hypothetical protein [Tanacetum cinerariifolium]